MSNQAINLRLTALKNAGKARLTNQRGEAVDCLIIPIKDNHLYESERGDIFLTVTAWENDKLKDGKTHLIKQSFNKEVREKMTEEERKTIPILGDMKPVGQEKRELPSYSAGQSVVPQNDGDLPF
jgi:hypothetical protein